MTKINVTADLFRRAYACVSKEETRYYLNGVSIESDPNGGAILVSTDGHRLIAIRDAQGFADGTAIVAADSGALKAMASKLADRVIVDGQQLTVTDSSERPIYIQAGDCVVDGTFPEWRRVIPSYEPETPSVIGAFNADLLPALARALCTGKFGHARLWAKNPNDPMLVWGNGPIAGFGVLMPIRWPDAPALPEWVRIGSVVDAPAAQESETV